LIGPDSILKWAIGRHPLPQNRQRGEMWTRCIPNSLSGSLFARQGQAGAQAPV